MSLPALPNLPTDNLYKFLAIFGLIIFLGCSFISLDIKTEIEEADFKNGIHDYNLKINNWRIVNQDTIIEEREKINLIQDSLIRKDEMDKLDKSLDDGYEFIKAMTDSMAYQYQLNIPKLNKLKKTSIYLMGGQVAGILLMIFGFYLWYFRVQKISDAILKKQLEYYDKKPEG
jgi:hypothetical protein